MDDPTTIALNLTFFGTLGVALVMFFGLFLVFIATLVIAGFGRLTAVTIVAVGRGLFRTGSRDEPAKPVKTAKANKPDRPAKTANPEPALSPGWAAAVAEADARAAVRDRSAAAPAVKVSVRDLPSPTAPAQDVAAVAPLVESATDRNGQLGSVPPAFQKASMPAAKSLLDTGSLVSMAGRPPLPRTTLMKHQNEQLQQPQTHERKAG